MKIKTVLIVLILMAVFTTNVNAQQLFKWVDEQGVTHYGEALPNNEIDHVAFEFSDDYQVPNPQNDYYSIQNQLKRLQEWRTQQLEEKKQAAEARAAKNPPPQEVVYLENNEPARRYYLPAYHPNFHVGFHPKFPRHHKPCCNKRGNRPVMEKPRSGISHQVKSGRPSSVFSASR